MSLPALDAHGFLRDREDWNEDVAREFAAEEGVTLTAAHWEILYLLREYHTTHEHTPAMRALVGLVHRRLGHDKGSSLYLLQLFPGSPARIATRIAGLPKPEHCL